MAPAPEASVSEACPAFNDGCPYSSNAFITDWLKTQKNEKAEKGACPAFDLGCPFRDVHDMNSLKAELQKLPSSHAGDAEKAASKTSSDEILPAHAALVGMLQAVHQTSQSVKEAVGGDCPVFQQACPFKNCVTSSGVSLVSSLETRSWGLLIGDNLAEEEEATEEHPSAEPAVASNDADGVGLAKKLKIGTQEAHKAAETVHFVKEFIKGKVPRDVYGQMVVNLYHVYQAMEEALDKCAENPLVDPLHFPEELCRADELAKDAEYFCGPGWESRPLSAVTAEYVQRLREVTEEAPELIVPHAYTRYLGDLSGGQVLKKAAIRGMALPKDGSGVHFYTFKRIANAKNFKDMYRARLDALEADPAIADRMVVEANLAFNFNTRMFQELDVLMGFEAAEAPAMPVEPPTAAQLAGPAAACPFAALAASGVPMPAHHPPLEASDGPAGGDQAAAAAAPGRVPAAAASRSTLREKYAAIAPSKLQKAAIAHAVVAGLLVAAAWALTAVAG